MKKLMVFACLIAATRLQARSPLSAEAAEGKRVFETSCAVGYCHGVDGRAGHGPRLRDRVWSRNYLYKTIEQGIPSSSMPAWGGKLSDEKIAAVISYIFTISKEDPASESTLEPAKISQPDAPADAPGKALFFDLTRDRNCGVCHRIDDAGADIALAFTGLRGTPVQVLLNQIRSRPVSERNIQVTLRNGEGFCGVKVGEDRTSIRVYDLAGAGPPVLRAIDRAALLGVKACPSLNVHADNSKAYSSQDLSSIAAFSPVSELVQANQRSRRESNWLP